MPDIHVLSPIIANQIAAGEVVERPASVVKELVENSIDAGASCISVSIIDGGISSISITDNGCGIKADQCCDAFLRHATSKIKSTEDLACIDSLGFRGEALASIAAVSCVTLTTREKGSETGMRVCVDGGDTKFAKQIACPEGTTLKVENLFSKTPARLRFLKSPRFESGHCADYMSRMILAHPEISFRYAQDGKTIYESYGDSDLKNAIYCIYGNHIYSHLLPVAYDDGYIRVDGFVGTQEVSHANRNLESFFVNGRYIRSASLSTAVENAFLTKVMIGRYPFALIRITISPKEIDVNIHPSKTQIKFSDENRVLETVSKACSLALKPAIVPSISIEPRVLTAHPDKPSIPVAKIISPDPIPAMTVEKTVGKSIFTILPSSASTQESIDKSFSGQHYYAPKEPNKQVPSYSDYREHSASYVYNDFEKQTPAEADTPVFRITPSVPSEKHSAPETVVQQSLPISKEYTLVGCIFNTYWIIEFDNNMYLIDQHAACERKLYEKYMGEEPGTASQNLLIPANLSLTPEDFEIAEQYRTELEKIGFRFTKTAEFSYSVEAVPFINGKLFEADFLCEAVHLLNSSGKPITKELVYETLVFSSCKHSIKAGDRITKDEMIQLINLFIDKSIPLTCPHGRPVIIKLSKQEIEKGFKRIV